MKNIVQIIGKHSPLIAASIEHNKSIIGANPKFLKAAILEIAKQSFIAGQKLGAEEAQSKHKSTYETENLQLEDYLEKFIQ